MISEHQFATHYSSAWLSVAPLSDGFWSFENKQVDRVDIPLHSVAPKGMRGIINEAAFRAFCEVYPMPRPIDKGRVAEIVERGFNEAIAYVARFSNAPPVEPSDIDADCYTDAVALLGRLVRYFPAQRNITLRPKFVGCGLLSACEGDLIVDDCLFEVKAGDRAFRITDLRQLLTYAALAYASDKLAFSSIGLFNPRTGVAWRRSLVEVCQSISGSRPNDTLSALAEQFSAASASR